MADKRREKLQHLHRSMPYSIANRILNACKVEPKFKSNDDKDYKAIAIHNVSNIMQGLLNFQYIIDNIFISL